MHSIVHDVLSRVPGVEGTEIEVRLTVPAPYFAKLHEQFSWGREGTYTDVEVKYADANDIRCIDGVWQRKRMFQCRALPFPVRCKLCVCVESVVDPAVTKAVFLTMRRKRWSYLVGEWRIEWTQSRRACNVEIEYAGEVQDLVASSRERGDLRGLGDALESVMPYMEPMVHNRTWNEHLRAHTGMPFLHMDLRHVPPQVYALHDRLMYLMSLNQPTSLTGKTIIADRPLVSLKYDGVRVILIVHRAGRRGVMWGLHRGLGVWSIPCVCAPERSVILDCELIKATREIVVFDMLYRDDEECQGSYTQRIGMLSTIRLPTVAGYTVRMKEFYPPGVVCQAWYDKLDLANTDGLIVHDGTSMLGVHARLYKWKPKHTIDLYVDRRGRLLDRSRTADYWECVPDHGHDLSSARVWEFEFVNDSTLMRPICPRKDKFHANSYRVCAEVRKAHRARMTIGDISVLLKSIQPRPRVSKRARRWEPI